MPIGGELGTVHVVVPHGIDDPRRPSGGNVYDRRVCAGLAARGWSVREHAAPGPWPDPLPDDLRAFAGALEGMPGGSVVLVDGLVASAAAGLLGHHVARLRVVVLVHLPLGVASVPRRPAERALLSHVAAVVTTSEWSRSWLLAHYDLGPDRVQVALPGTDPAPPTDGTPSRGALVCVGAVTWTKGHDLLLDALQKVRGDAWTCTCVGSLELEPGFARSLRGQVERVGLADRVRFDGPLVGDALDAAYRAADVLVLPSRLESYGMVVTEALARGVPVIATDAGGTSEALGRTPDGTVPGLLVPAADAEAFAVALRTWLGDPSLRRQLRHAAAARGAVLPRWSDTAAGIARALAGH